MMQRTIINTNIRLNLSRPEDRRAWEYLQHLDRKKYRSYSRAVVAAINDYFSRQERLTADPYLETREKEDAFLQKVLETIREGLQASGAGLAGLTSLLQGVRPAVSPPEPVMTDEDLDAVKNTIPALAEAMESVREKMIIFQYQLGYILTGKRRLSKSLDVMKPELERYTRIATETKKKSKERNALLSEKKATPVLNILKHRDLSRRIAELTEELEELRSEKRQLLASLDYAEDTGLSTVRKDISAMEANLVKLEQQEQKYTAELNAALAEYNELKAQTADFDPDELAMAQLEIRPQKEASAESRVQAAYGDKFDFWTMIGAKREVEELLGEEAPRSLMERLRRKEQEKERAQRDRQPQRKKQKDRGWER